MSLSRSDDIYRIGIFSKDGGVLLFETPSIHVIIATIKAALEDGHTVRVSDKVKLALDELKKRASAEWN